MEHSLVQGLQASFVVVFEFGRRRSSSKHLVCKEVRRVICSLDERQRTARAG